MARERDDDDDDRPRRSRDDDYEDRRPTQTTNPGSAKAAAILWIIIGSLGLIGGLLSIANPNLQNIVQILVALAFLITGIQTLMGSVGGIMGAGIASVILASIGLLIGLFVVVLGGALAGGAAGGGGGQGAAAVGGFVMIIGILALVGPTLLMIAGILALKGNTKYKAWVAYKKGQSGGGRRARDEYEDQEERPRKRRADDDD